MLNDNKTIVNGKVIDMTCSEENNAAEFHKSRVAFAIKDGEFLINERDAREHRVYLEEDYGVGYEEFETLVRGYIKPNKIVFYVSSAFNPISEDVLLCYLGEALRIAGKYFGSGNYCVGNGVRVGEIGEEWPVLQELWCMEVTAW